MLLIIVTRILKEFINRSGAMMGRYLATYISVNKHLAVYMLHMLCNTSGIQKIALHYISKDGAFDYGI